MPAGAGSEPPKPLPRPDCFGPARVWRQTRKRAPFFNSRRVTDRKLLPSRRCRTGTAPS
jgi:hypothetical protein